MKNSKETIKKFLAFILTGLIIIFINSCNDLNEDEMDLNLSSGEQLITWNDLLDQIDLESEIAFVQNGESIQDAVNEASPGDVIYIEPGTYQENLTINRSDINLVGLSLSPNDLLINRAEENNIEILKLYDQNSIDNFKQNAQQRVNRNRISDFSRTELGKGIVHYQFKVRMGDGEFDVVRIHRVCRERRPFLPIPTKGNVFMVHGALAGFSGTFFSPGLESSGDINANTSSPFYLASKNIDVWGIDLGWTMVPAETEDFSFFEGWGFEKDARHTLIAMRIARLIRGFTGQGVSGLNILGFSSGNTTAYAAANQETQKQNWMKRHIKGIITVDDAFKFGFDAGCADADKYLNEIESGKLQNDFGAFFNFIGGLALSAPDAPSPIPDFAGLTNSQAVRAVVSSPAAPDFGVYFHFFGGDINDLFYCDDNQVFRMQASYSPFMPTQIWYEFNAVNCSSTDVTFDDHLSLISVPIFYIGAGGGTGAAGEHTSSLTASTDITNHLVSLAEPAIDFGHVDTWLANDANQLVWVPLRNWIVDHR